MGDHTPIFRLASAWLDVRPQPVQAADLLAPGSGDDLASCYKRNLRRCYGYPYFAASTPPMLVLQRAAATDISSDWTNTIVQALQAKDWATSMR